MAEEKKLTKKETGPDREMLMHLEMLRKFEMLKMMDALKITEKKENPAKGKGKP